jgi:hypothetical protein
MPMAIAASSSRLIGTYFIGVVAQRDGTTITSIKPVRAVAPDLDESGMVGTRITVILT